MAMRWTVKAALRAAVMDSGASSDSPARSWTSSPRWSPSAPSDSGGEGSSCAHTESSHESCDTHARRADGGRADRSHHTRWKSRATHAMEKQAHPRSRWLYSPECEYTRPRLVLRPKRSRLSPQSLAAHLLAHHLLIRLALGELAQHLQQSEQSEAGVDDDVRAVGLAGVSRPRMSCGYDERVLRARVLACRPCKTGAGWPHMATPAGPTRTGLGDVQHPHNGTDERSWPSCASSVRRPPAAAAEAVACAAACSGSERASRTLLRDDWLLCLMLSVLV